MNIIFFDASALVKRYSVERGSPLLNSLFALNPRPNLYCVIIGALEIVFILTRKRNDGRLTPDTFRRALLEFRAEVLEDREFTTISVSNRLVVRAMDEIESHNINATDALVLRAALDLQATLSPADNLSFWSSDKRLLRAAAAEGLTTFDPEQDSLERLREILDIAV